MCALIADPSPERGPQQKPLPRKGPGPSRIAYRLRRFWAKSWVRNCALVYIPLSALGGFGWYLAGQEEVRAAVEQQWDRAMEALADRPEFAVTQIEVQGGRPALQARVREELGLPGTVSSMRLDVDALRAEVEAMGRVESAVVTLLPPDTLQISIVERIPAALWRDDDGVTHLVDRGGVLIEPVADRAARSDLPLLLGEGATEAVDEALALIATAPEIAPRLRALVRIGERRWDMVLTRDLTIRLPEEDPARALARVAALHYGEELLDRDLATIDLRLPGRPTLRMTERAAETVRALIERLRAGGEDT